MANFFELNGVNIRVANGEWDFSRDYIGSVARRMAAGDLGPHERMQKALWEGTTPPLTPDEIQSYVGLLDGQWDRWGYETTTLNSDRAFVQRGGTRDVSAAKVGSANLRVASAGTAVLPTVLAGSNTNWGYVTWKKDGTGDYSAWTHVGYRASTTDTYVTAAIDAGVAATDWSTKAETSLSLLGTDSAGTNAQAEYDDTVVFWFDPLAAWMVIWTGASYVWPHATAVVPTLEMSGNALQHADVATLAVRTRVLDVEAVQGWIDGVFYDNAGTVSFQVEEAL
jgi:hypothetical protein